MILISKNFSRYAYWLYGRGCFWRLLPQIQITAARTRASRLLIASLDFSWLKFYAGVTYTRL